MKKADNILQTKEDFLPLCPHRLITLWDMIQFFLHQFATFWEELLIVKRHYEAIGIKSPSDLISDDARVQLESLIGHLHYECKKLQIPKSTDRIWRFGLRLERDICTNQIVMAELQEIYGVMSYELDDNYFAFIPKSKTEYFEKDKKDALFGPAVYEAFPDACPEIKESGNCLAVGLNTASVFHLMRASEFGLHALAEELGAVPEKWPIEFSEWRQVIIDIEAKLKTKRDSINQSMSKGYEKDETLEFYSGLMSDVYHLKITRDRIMHTRESFDAVGLDGNKDDSAALAVYGDVKRFMQRLAAKILKTIPPPR